jgi:hypothetical protein
VEYHDERIRFLIFQFECLQMIDFVICDASNELAQREMEGAQATDFQYVFSYGTETHIELTPYHFS